MPERPAGIEPAPSDWRSGVQPLTPWAQDLGGNRTRVPGFADRHLASRPRGRQRGECRSRTCSGLTTTGFGLADLFPFEQLSEKLSMRKADESNAKPEGSICFRGSARPCRVHLPRAEDGGHDPQTQRSRPLSRRCAALPRSSSTEESVGIEPKAQRLAQVSGLAMAQPCSLSVAGSQGLEPRRAGFGNRLAPRALPKEKGVESPGIEPGFPDCRSGVLPLDDDPMEPARIELASPRCGRGVLPLDDGPLG